MQDYYSIYSPNREQSMDRSNTLLDPCVLTSPLDRNVRKRENVPLQTTVPDEDNIFLNSPSPYQINYSPRNNPPIILFDTLSWLNCKSINFPLQNSPPQSGYALGTHSNIFISRKTVNIRTIDDTRITRIYHYAGTRFNDCSNNRPVSYMIAACRYYANNRTPRVPYC